MITKRFDVYLREHRYLFGRKPVRAGFPTFWISDRDHRAHLEAGRRITALAEKATDAFVREPAVRKVWGFPKGFEEWILHRPRHERALFISRLDFFGVGDRLKSIEFNTDGTAGHNQIEGVQRAADRVFQPGGRHISTMHGFFSHLTQTLRDHFGRLDRVTLAVVDWTGVEMTSEFEAVARHMRPMLKETLVVTPSKLTYRGGKLRYGRTIIDAVYRRVIGFELWRHQRLVEPFMRAYLENAFLCLGSLRSEVAWSKNFFTWLWLERGNAKRFTPAERAWIARHIPETLNIRALTDDQRLHLIKHRRRYVLKPAWGFGGAGVHMGSDTPPAAWERLLHSPVDRIVQERIEATTGRYGYVESYPKRQRMYEAPGIFLYGSRFGGYYARMCPDPIINLTRGACLVPVRIRS